MFEADSKLVAQIVPSPNHDARTAGIDMILLHYTGMQTADAARARLCEAAAKVSAHYLVQEDGRIEQLVPEGRRAWHAGASSWDGATDINSCSIGIEIVNPGHEFGYRDFPAAQIEAVIALCRDIAARHPVPAHRVLAHSDVAPARKQDPGEKFPWRALYAAGIGLWVEPAPVMSGPILSFDEEGEEVAELQRMLADYGYGAEVTASYDQRTADIITAFQRHFRPAQVDGIADISTIVTLRALIVARGTAGSTHQRYVYQ